MPVDASVLVHLLDSSSEFERRGAAEELGRLKVSSLAVVRALQQRQANDSSEGVRRAAAVALDSPANQAVVQGQPPDAQILPVTQAVPMSRSRRSLANLFAYSAGLGAVIVLVALWFLLAYGFSTGRLLFLINAVVVSAAVYLTSRWVDQGRRAAVLLYGGTVLAGAVLNLAAAQSLNWVWTALGVFYFLALASLWRSGELK